MSTTATIPAQPDYENPPRGIDKLYEVVDGEFVESKTMGASQTRIAARLLTALAVFLRENKLGEADTEMLFILRRTPRLERRPDVSYVSFERWAADVPVPEGTWDVIPDLAVEVVSPSNSAAELFDKVTDHFEAGARRVWVVYPEERIIHDYASLDEIHVLRGDASLDGGDVLPGSSIKLADLFNAV